MSIIERGESIGVAVEAPLEIADDGEVKARGYWEQVWLRFKRDRAALAGGIVVILMVLVAFVGAPLTAHILGHGPNAVNTRNAYVANDYVPVGPLTQVDSPDGSGSWFYVLGADGSLGRDEFLRLLYGAQVSLLVAVIATIVGVGFGILLGVIAGYYSGWRDTLVSRLIDVIMAFPFLLFAIALAATIGDRVNSYTTFGVLEPGTMTVIIVLSIFSWFYPARIIRGQVLSLREKEFVEAARMVGSSNWRIMSSHLMPHLMGPIIVYSTLIVAINVLAEAGLSFLHLGVKAPTASWGALLEDATAFYTVQPWLMLWPGLAVLMLTLAFNLLGDGLRDSFDPRGSAH